MLDAPKKWVDSWANRIEKHVKKPLEDLKNQIAWKTDGKEKMDKNDKISNKELEKWITYEWSHLLWDLARAKNQWLTLKEEKIAKKMFKRYLEDVKKHPEAYFMSLKKLESWNRSIPYHYFEDAEFGFIDDYDLSLSLWAEFKLTPEEVTLFEKYDLFSDL